MSCSSSAALCCDSRFVGSWTPPPLRTSSPSSAQGAPATRAASNGNWNERVLAFYVAGERYGTVSSCTVQMRGLQGTYLAHRDLAAGEGATRGSTESSPADGQCHIYSETHSVTHAVIQIQVHTSKTNGCGVKKSAIATRHTVMWYGIPGNPLTLVS